MLDWGLCTVYGTKLFITQPENSDLEEDDNDMKEREGEERRTRKQPQHAHRIRDVARLRLRVCTERAEGVLQHVDVCNTSSRTRTGLQHMFTFTGGTMKGRRQLLAVAGAEAALRVAHPFGWPLGAAPDAGELRRALMGGSVESGTVRLEAVTRVVWKCATTTTSAPSTLSRTEGTHRPTDSQGM